MKLKIVEWNINQRMNYSGVDMPSWISEVILEEKADIIALTEVYRGNNWECIKKKSFNNNYAVFESSNNSAGQNDIAIAINTKSWTSYMQKHIIQVQWVFQTILK